MNRLSILIGVAFAANLGQAAESLPPTADGESAAGSASVKDSSVQDQSKPASPIVLGSAKATPRTISLLSEGPGIPYGGFLLYPEIALRQTYDSNIYALPEKDIGDWITTPSVSLTGRSNWSRHRLGFSVGADANRYHEHSSENVHDYWVSVDGRLDLAPGRNVFGGLEHSRNHEDRGSPNPQLSPDPTVYYSTKAFLGSAMRKGPVSVRFGVAAEDIDYVTPSGLALPSVGSNDDRDELQYSIGARVGYELTPLLTPFIQISTDTRNYKQAVDDFGFRRSSNGYRASIGATFNSGRALSGEAFLGKMHQAYDDDRFANVDKPYFGASMTWRPLRDTRMRAILDRALEETTVSNASGYLDTTVAVDVEHAVSAKLIANARIARSINEYQGTGRKDKVTDASAGFKYYIDPVVYLGADFRLINRDSNQLQEDYSRNQLTFSVGYTPGRKGITAEDSSGMRGLSAGLGSGTGLRGRLTPKLAYFTDSGSSAYLNRYNYLERASSGSRDGLIADLDFSLTYGDLGGNFLLAERERLGREAQRARLEGNGGSAKLAAYFSTFTTATGTLDYLYNPDKVVGGTDPAYANPLFNAHSESSHVAYFNNDSANASDYKVKRTRYGGSVALRPSAFNDQAAVELAYDGYKREGSRVTNYVLDSYSLRSSSGTAEQNQWRGYARSINEQAGKLTYNLSVMPLDSWLVNYEFSVDRFRNDTSPVTFSTLSQWTGATIPFETGADPNTPLHFTPDSTQISNSVRLTKRFGDSAIVSGGMSMTRLEQNTFSQPQYAFGYTTGRTDTDTWYLTGKFNASRSVGVETFARYSQRDNASSYPVAGFYDPVSIYGNQRMVMPRINRLKNLGYGIEARLYPSFLKTTFSAGWKHEDKKRDLTYGIVPALAPPLVLYGDRTDSDELFVKLVSRPSPRWTVRLTPSYQWANETGSVTDPDKMLKLKTSVAYTNPEWNELAVAGYYNYTYKKNDSLSYANYSLTPPGFATSQKQQATNRAQAFGINLSMIPREALKVNLSYDWNQNDLSSYYFSSNRLRFDYPLAYPGIINPHPTVPLDFVILDQTGYKVNTHTITAGIERQWKRYLFMGNYSVNWAQGHNADGLAGQTLPQVDDRVDNLLHSLSLGVEYAWRKDVTIRGIYAYDRYSDKVYDALDGSRNAVWLGLDYRL